MLEVGNTASGPGECFQRKKLHFMVSRWLVAGPFDSLSYINDSWYVSGDKKQRDLRQVSLGLPGVQFTQPFVPTNAVDLRRYYILSAEAIRKIIVQDALFVDYCSE